LHAIGLNTGVFDGFGQGFKGGLVVVSDPDLLLSACVSAKTIELENVTSNARATVVFKDSFTLASPYK
jgi:glutamate synthase domain-containing protein 3